MFICPKCSGALAAEQGRMLCIENHSYDVSKYGYVNLLLGAKQGTHGDNKEMILARRVFLSSGYYSPIINEIYDIIKSNTAKKSISVLDAGCGEGYYTGGVKEALEKNGISANIYGIDVSKDAVTYASRGYKNINFAVASINALPFADNSFDVVISLFAPLNENEFVRILKPDGILITVSPSENHLWGLKNAIYDVPYKNPPSTFDTFILKKIADYSREWSVMIENHDDISNLFKMTPYYHKSSPKDIEKALNLTRVDTVIGFEYCVYTK